MQPTFNSITRRIAFGAFASWFSRGMTIMLGLFFLPVLFRYLPKEELGIWLLLGQSWAAMGILDFGISVTLTRRIALAKGKSGGDPNAELNDESRRDIADLIASGRRVYPVLAIVVFGLSWSAGYFYLRNLQLSQVSHYTVWIAWTILCLSQAVNVWSHFWDCLVNGVGYVGWDAIIASLFNTVTIAAQIVAVFCGGRLITLAIIATIGAVLQRVWIRRFARHRCPELFSLKGRWNPAVMKGMGRLAVRAWLTSVGVILVQNTDGFFIASMQGAENIPAYRAAFLVVLNIHMLAGVFAASSTVFISHLWQAGEFKEVQLIVERNLRLGLLLVCCGGAALIAGGASLFDVWLGSGNYVGLSLIIAFLVFFVLDQQSFIVSSGCRATEDEAFAETTLGGGLLKLALAFFMIRRFGLLGLALANVISQLVTTHWFVVYRGFRRLQLGFRRYFIFVLIPCISAFVLALGLSYALIGVVRGLSDSVRLVAGCTTSGIVLIVFLWYLVLDVNQRQRLVSLIALKT